MIYTVLLPPLILTGVKSTQAVKVQILLQVEVPCQIL